MINTAIDLCLDKNSTAFYFRFDLYRCFISSRNLPAPRTTQVSGFSACITGTPVSLLINLSRPLRREPPPVITMPRSTISAASSGGVFSRACLTPSSICSTGSFSDFLISTESISRVLGRPDIASLPLDSLFQPFSQEKHCPGETSPLQPSFHQ